MDTDTFNHHSSEWQGVFLMDSLCSGNSGTQQSQSSTVNISGHSNRVTVNQAQSGDGGSYHGANPRCLLICTTLSH
jgi:hypothetical protein